VVHKGCTRTAIRPEDVQKEDEDAKKRKITTENVRDTARKRDGGLSHPGATTGKSGEPPTITNTHVKSLSANERGKVYKRR